MGGGVLVVVAGGQLSRPETTRSFPFVCSSLLIQTSVTSYRQNSCAVFFSPFLGTLLSGDSVMGCVCVSDEGPHTHTHTYTRVGRRRGRGGCWARFQSLCCALLVGRCLLVTGLAVWSLTARCRLSDSWDMESSGSGSDECVPLRPAARLPRRPKRGRRSGEAREAWLERTERPDGIPDFGGFGICPCCLLAICISIVVRHGIHGYTGTRWPRSGACPHRGRLLGYTSSI